jgi:hypothetical protein
MNPLYQAMATSVFERMSLAAAQHDAINLGQGFPDFGWPEPILEAASRALIEGSNQYAPSRGLPALRDAVAGHYQRHHGLGIEADGVFQPAPAPHYSDTILDRPDPPRREGQDGAAILEALGYGADDVKRILG